MVIEYTKLAFVAMLPPILSIVLYELKKIHPEWDDQGIKYQVAVGVLFGLMSIAGTEWGITVDGYNINCRDAAPICAGLLFGGPAGIIAGLIGGAERWFSVYWGGGTFTRVACSASTVIVGIASGVIRKYMLDNRRPGWLLALFLGVSMEVFHLTMVFITNPNQTTEAMHVVEVCTGPMITAVGLSVLAATMSLTLLSGKAIVRRQDQIHIVDLIQRYLLISVLIGFTITMVFVTYLQNNVAKRNAKNLLILSVSDMAEEIEHTAEDNMLDLAVSFINRYDRSGDFEKAVSSIEATEINLIDEDGIVAESNNKDYIGYDMADNEDSAQYLELLGEDPEITELVEDFRENAVDGTLVKYVGMAYDGKAVQIGFSESDFLINIAKQVRNAAYNHHVGETGAIIITNSAGDIVSVSDGYQDLTQNYIIHYDPEDKEEYYMYTVEAGDESYYVMYTQTEGYYVVGVIPVSEAMETRDLTAYLMGFTQILVSALLFIMIYMLIKQVVVNGIYSTNDTMHAITKGNLDARVDVRHTKEFSRLSDDINAMVEALKNLITEANARIDRELLLAKDIQKAALPTALSYKGDNGLFAIMDPAKEVGGDFYDFYFKDSNKLVILIADVSGKGIPAALFMMRAKTQLKGLTETSSGMDVAFTLGNNALCEGNEAEMFVTSWEGMIDLETGVLTYVNAGHNPPLVKHGGGRFEFIKGNRGMVLAAMEGMTYKTNTIQLAPGDEIFLYTDGVTEATNASQELYGDFRLRAALNSAEFENMEELCHFVKADVDRFVGDADQFDDITMLAFRYSGTGEK